MNPACQPATPPATPPMQAAHRALFSSIRSPTPNCRVPPSCCGCSLRSCMLMSRQPFIPLFLGCDTAASVHFHACPMLQPLAPLVALAHRPSARHLAARPPALARRRLQRRSVHPTAAASPRTAAASPPMAARPACPVVCSPLVVKSVYEVLAMLQACKLGEAGARTASHTALVVATAGRCHSCSQPPSRPLAESISPEPRTLFPEAPHPLMTHPTCSCAIRRCARRLRRHRSLRSSSGTRLRRAGRLWRPRRRSLRCVRLRLLLALPCARTAMWPAALPCRHGHPAVLRNMAASSLAASAAGQCIVPPHLLLSPCGAACRSPLLPIACPPPRFPSPQSLLPATPAVCAGGAHGGPPAAPQWQELHDDQGRPYYYNPTTGVTQVRRGKEGGGSWRGGKAIILL